MQHHVVLKVAAKLLLPFILLFALYVQFHGDFGPGGGFQAGVIFGAGIILYALVFGAAHARAVITPGAVRIAAALGVLLYTGVGVASLLLGANFLDYDVLGADPVAGQHLGILLVEVGVGLTVTAVMILLFYAFAGGERTGTGRDGGGRGAATRAGADRTAGNRAVANREGAGRAAGGPAIAGRAIMDRDGAGRAGANRAATD